MIYKHFFKTLLLLSLFCKIDSLGIALANDLPIYTPTTHQAIVTEVENEEHDNALEEIFQSEQIIQNLKIKILSGDLSKQEFKLQNFLTNTPYFDIKLKKGDRILIDIDNITHEIYLATKDNSNIIIFLSSLFLAGLWLIYQKSSLKFIYGLLFCITIIFFALIPLIFLSYNPIFWTMSVCVFLSAIIIFITNGQKAQSTCSTISTALSIFILTLTSIILNHSSGIQGIDSPENIIIFGEYPRLNFMDISTSATILTATGALIYLSQIISNYIFLYFTPKDNFNDVLSSVKNFSKTPIFQLFFVLIFSKIGLLFPLILLSYQTNLLKFINLNRFFLELSSLILILIIMLLSVPITTLICNIYTKRNLITKK